MQDTFAKVVQLFLTQLMALLERCASQAFTVGKEQLLWLHALVGISRAGLAHQSVRFAQQDSIVQVLAQTNLQELSLH